MMQLQWRSDDGGYTAGRYRIRPCARGWVLERLNPAGVVDTHPGASSTHRDLGSARLAAGRDHRDRQRRYRIRVHLVIGLGSAAAIVAMSLDSLLGFVAIVSLFYVGASSLLDAIWIWSHRAWGAERGSGPNPLTWVDRSIIRLIDLSETRRTVPRREDQMSIVVR